MPVFTVTDASSVAISFEATCVPSILATIESIGTSMPLLAEAWIGTVVELSVAPAAGEHILTAEPVGYGQVLAVVVFRKISRRLLLSTAAKSGRPSPLKSPLATA